MLPTSQINDRFFALIENVPATRWQYFYNSEGELVQQESAVHTIIRIMPRSYTSRLNYYHGVIEHRYPFVASFGTMLSREKFREFKKGIESNYGCAVDLREGHGMGHTEVTLAYCPHHFNGEEPVYRLVEGTLNLVRMLHVKSNLTPPDRC